MNTARPANRFSRLLAAAALASAALPALVSADTLFIGTTQFPPVIVQDIKEGTLTYKVKSSGEIKTRDMAGVTKMLIDGETNLNAAEEAFAKKEWAPALDGYKRAAASTKPFVKLRAVSRMMETAANSKQFEAQVTAFAELAKLDPAAAAKAPKIELPTDKAKLKAVLPALEQAAATARTSDALKTLIVSIALEAGEVAIAQKYAPQTGAPTPQPPVPPNGADPTPPQADMSSQAVNRLNSAKIAMKSKNPTAAIAAIEGGGGRAAFTKPDLQFEALTILAEARGQLANTPAAAQEAAVAYMRIVAHARTLGRENDPEVADAMLKAATLIETTLKQPKEAATLYNTLATDKRWEATPAAAEAKKAAARLKASASAG